MLQIILNQIDDKTVLVKMPLRTLYQEIGDWSENRVLNEEKVAKITEAYKERDIALITSLFRCASYPDGRYVLLDGHHRKEAAKEFLEEFKEFNENLDVFVVIHKKNYNEDIYDLHIKSNLSEPLKDKQIPSYKRAELINVLKNHPIIKNGISKNPNCKKAHQPKISLNELAEIAGEIIIKYPQISPELIAYNIKEINHRLSLLFTRDNLPNITIEGRTIKPDIIEKAHTIKFYLNIRDSKFNKDIWIHYIDNPSVISLINLSEQS